MSERRATERRPLSLVADSIERKKERRAEERRISPRLPRRMWIEDPLEGGIARVVEGEVGLGGASWTAAYAPLASKVEVRFRVPEHSEEIIAHAAVLSAREEDSAMRVRVVFTDLALRSELALANYLDRQSRGVEARTTLS